MSFNYSNPSIPIAKSYRDSFILIITEHLKRNKIYNTLSYKEEDAASYFLFQERINLQINQNKPMK
jgi:hypothetical protein